MMLKEYRIVMPLSVEEYRIAQLYMVMKKSEDFTNSPGSAITIKENRPYTNGPGGSGQYAEKIYHIADHLPVWLKSFLPKEAMIVEEHSWNAYPYTKTKYVYPFVDRFFMEVETKYLPDDGQCENVFNLSKKDLKQRQVGEIEWVDKLCNFSVRSKTEFIDFVNDSTIANDNKKELNPKTYVSKYTGRGPLSENWLKLHLNGPGEKTLMCAYKLCRIEFKFWGIQSRVERLIDDTALRKTFLSAHRSAWCWQDEWVHLTLQDVRNMEKTVQQRLDERLNKMNTMFNEQNLNDGHLISATSNTEESVEEVDLRIWSRKLSIENDEDGLAEDEEDDDYDEKREMNNEISDNDEWADARSASLFSSNGVSQGKTVTDSNEQCLILLFYAGNMGDYAESQFTSVITLKSTMEKVSQYRKSKHAPKVSIKLVKCPELCNDIMHYLSSVLIVKSTWSSAHTMAHILTRHENYGTCIDTIIECANAVYLEFSCGKTYNVQIVADSIGAILAYDALLQSNGNAADDQTKFTFTVKKLICLGSPIGTVLLQRKLAGHVDKTLPPGNTNVYNLFFTNDPSAARIEPILDEKFQSIPPAPIERSHRATKIAKVNRMTMHSSMEIMMSLSSDYLWGDGNRIDHYVYAPSIVSQLPVKFLDIVLTSSYWENEDIASFILDKISVNNRSNSDCSEDFVGSFNNSQTDFRSRTSFGRIGSNYVFKNLTPNHSSSDTFLSANSRQYLRARFSYGPLKVVPLNFAKVDVYAQSQESTMLQMNVTSSKNWMILGTGTTDPYGRLNFEIKERLLPGSYNIRMVVRVDKSMVHLGAYVVPQNSKVVVFGIDGALMASFTVRGKNAKVQGAAVDCVRYWHRLGYPIIYLSGRPRTQQPSLSHWLFTHNFPRGPLLLSDGGIYPHDSRHKKLNLLKHLCKNAQISSIQAAYVSQKDVSMFKECGIRIEKIYVVVKKSAVLGYNVNSLRSPIVEPDELSDDFKLRDNNVNEFQIEVLSTGYTEHVHKLSSQLKLTLSV